MNKRLLLTTKPLSICSLVGCVIIKWQCDGCECAHGPGGDREEEKKDVGTSPPPRLLGTFLGELVHLELKKIRVKGKSKIVMKILKNAVHVLSYKKRKKRKTKTAIHLKCLDERSHCVLGKPMTHKTGTMIIQQLGWTLGALRVSIVRFLGSLGSWGQGHPPPPLPTKLVKKRGSQVPPRLLRKHFGRFCKILKLVE